MTRRLLAIALLVLIADAAAGQTSEPFSIPTGDLHPEVVRRVVVDREPGQYLGHPSTVRLAGDTLLVAYPKGHGVGAIVLKRSVDGGRTWGPRLPVPENWSSSKETPTLYEMTDRAGTTRLVLFSGLYPIRMSVSEDRGLTWTPLSPIGDFGGIVAMSSVADLGEGRYLAFFHDDGRFFREKGERRAFTVYATASADGGLSWSEPVTVTTHPDADLCEPGLVWSPDGTRMALLLRENSRKHESFVVFSEDGGHSWSPPKELPRELTGDRHTARYAEDGRLLVTFRDQAAGSPHRGDWVLWIGSFGDLVSTTPGRARLRLLDNRKGSDCCYPGFERLSDGSFVTTTYGHWMDDEEPYIMSIHFTTQELDETLQTR